MGSLIKRDTNTWLIKYDLKRRNGKRRQVYKTFHGTKRAAEEELANLTSTQGKTSYVAPSKMTTADWMNSWIEGLRAEAESMTPKTIERFEQLIKTHINYGLGDIPLQEVRYSDLVFFEKELKNEGLSRARSKKDREKLGLSLTTIKHIRRVLSMAFDEAVRVGVKLDNPTLSFPKTKRDRKGKNSVKTKKKVLTTSQLNQLLDSFKGEELYPLIALAAGTGMRQGEILALRWDNVDLENGTIEVLWSVESLNKSWRFKEPKNGESRTIGIMQDLVKLLSNYKINQLKKKEMCGINQFEPCALVFPRSFLEPCRPMDRHQVSRAVAKKSEELGFKGYTFHSLRHTHATQLLTNGLPIRLVANRLGHSSEATTANIYSHYLNESDDAAVELSLKLMKGMIQVQ